MLVMIIGGQQRELPTRFVSQAVYDACSLAQPWDPQRYQFVEIGDVLPAWVTADEQTRLQPLTTLAELEQFVDDVGLRPILDGDFYAWQRGERLPHA
ncbi:MAG: hypothetical protein KC425_16585 [Anaerolineales bacterium]|nr:hypothetical protein [Anaerolineales bacterium]